MIYVHRIRVSRDLRISRAGEADGKRVNIPAPANQCELHVALVPGLGPALLTSLLVLGAGALLYAGRNTVAALQRRLAVLPEASAVWDGLMAAIVRLAEGYSSRWQNGSLRWYLAVTALTLPALCLPVLHAGHLSWHSIGTSLADLPWYGLLLCVLLAITTVAAVQAPTRLAAAIAMTTIGFLVSIPLLTKFFDTPYVDPSTGFRFVYEKPWIQLIGAKYKFGIDGISMLLILLTTALTAIAVLGVSQHL